jgi:hypothetical protein
MLSPLLALLALLGLCLSSVVLAAPTTSTGSDDDAAANASRSAAARSNALDPTVAAESQSSSKTIQMLLELQSSKPPIETGDRLNVRPERGDRLDANPRRPLAATVPPPAPQPSSAAPSQNPFLRAIEQARPSATRDVAPPRPSTAEWKDVGSQRPAAGNDGSGGSRGELPGAATASEPVRLWFVAGLLRFVRENRESVLIGSVLVLALVGLSASKASQRRR